MADKKDIKFDDPAVDEANSGMSLKESRAVRIVTDSKEQSLRFYRNKLDRFNYFDHLYQDGATKSNTRRKRANLHLPIAFQQTESFVAQMLEATGSEPPFLEYQGRTPDDEDVAGLITEHTQYQLEEGDFYLQYVSFLRNLGKYGTGIMKINWETDTQMVDVIVEEEVPVLDEKGDPIIEGDGIQTEYKESVIKEAQKIHDGPRFYNISVFDFFVPRSADTTDVQKLDWVIHRSFRDFDTVAKNPNYKNLDKLKKLVTDKDTPGATVTDEHKLEQLQQQNDHGSQKYLDKIEILEWWGDFRFKKDEPKEPALITVAVVNGAGSICLRCTKNPLNYNFKPFSIGTMYPIENEFYGYGILHHIQGLIEESSALRNARLDATNQSLNHMWIASRTAGLNTRDLRTEPDKIIWANDINALRRLDFSGITPSSQDDLAKIDFDIQNTTEIINPRQDVSNVGAAFGGTATGVNFLAAKANLRLLEHTRLLQHTFFKNLGLIMLMFNRQMLEDEVYFRVSDEDINPYRILDPQAYASEVDFKPISNPEKLTNAEKRENLAYMVQTMGQLIGLAQEDGISINWGMIMENIGEISGFKNPERIVSKGPKTIVQTPDGQLVTPSGQPVQLVQLDEEGQPIQNEPVQ